MPIFPVGFNRSATLSDCPDQLAAFGPTAACLIGFDPGYDAKNPQIPPTLPQTQRQSLIDTGASHCSIDADLGALLQLACNRTAGRRPLAIRVLTPDGREVHWASSAEPASAKGVAKDVNAATTARVRRRRHDVPWAGWNYKHLVILRAGGADQSGQQYGGD